MSNEGINTFLKDVDKKRWIKIELLKRCPSFKKDYDLLVKSKYALRESLRIIRRWGVYLSSDADVIAARKDAKHSLDTCLPAPSSVLIKYKEFEKLKSPSPKPIKLSIDLNFSQTNIMGDLKALLAYLFNYRRKKTGIGGKKVGSYIGEADIKVYDVCEKRRSKNRLDWRGFRKNTNYRLDSDISTLRRQYNKVRNEILHMERKARVRDVR